MLLTVSGPPGSGKSTVATGLADALDYEHVSGGDIFRQLADERGLSLADFNALAETDESIDRDLDRRLRTIARDRDEVILESRLSGWMAGEYADLRIWLDAPDPVRVARIADRESKSDEQARRETEKRERSESKRYRDYYGIDIADLRIYDLVVNTARWGPDETLTILVEAVDTYDPAIDEGRFPIVDVEYPF